MVLMGPVLSPFAVPTPGTPDFERDRFVPMLAIHETPRGYELEVELPFATLEDVDVRAHRHALVVRCTHAIDQYATSRTPRFGSFVRRIHLHHAIDTRGVETTLSEGTLRIVAPKMPTH